MSEEARQERSKDEEIRVLRRALASVKLVHIPDCCTWGYYLCPSCEERDGHDRGCALVAAGFTPDTDDVAYG